jgi:hypothetical protein
VGSVVSVGDGSGDGVADADGEAGGDDVVCDGVGPATGADEDDGEDEAEPVAWGEPDGLGLADLDGVTVLGAPAEGCRKFAGAGLPC